MSTPPRLARVTLAALLAASPIGMADAAPLSLEETATLREEISRLRRQQAEQQAALDAANARLQVLERQIAAIDDRPAGTAAAMQQAQHGVSTPVHAAAALIRTARHAGTTAALPRVTRPGRVSARQRAAGKVRT